MRRGHLRRAPGGATTWAGGSPAPIARWPASTWPRCAIRYPNDPYFYKTSMIGYDHEPIFAVGSLLGGRMPRHVPPDGRDGGPGSGRDDRRRGPGLGDGGLPARLDHDKETDGLALALGDAATYLDGSRAHRQPADRLLPGAGARRRARRLDLRRVRLCFDVRQERDARLPYRAGQPSRLSDRRAPQPSGQRRLQPGPGSRRQGPDADSRGVAATLAEEERWRQVLTSLVVCLSPANLYTEQTTVDALASAGFSFSGEDLQRLGADTLRRKNLFKQREGFDLESLRIPRRIYETASPIGPIDEAFMRQALAHFKQKLDL